MLKNPIINKIQLEDLYSHGQSLAETAITLGCSVHKIKYWMSKYKIPTRSISDAVYLKLNPTGDPFKIKDDLSKDDMFLLGLGIGIYWGEGNKSEFTSALRVGNSDPGLINAFINFVKDIYGLENRRFSYSIICFNDSDPVTVRAYWSKQLKISPEKFGKITVIPQQGKGTYRKKSLYGVCTVQANNIKLRKLVLEKIESLRKKYNSPVSSTAERRLGKS